MDCIGPIFSMATHFKRVGRVRLCTVRNQVGEGTSWVIACRCDKFFYIGIPSIKFLK